MKCLVVDVKGWGCARYIYVESTRVLFEVATHDCCSICNDRIEEVRETLKLKQTPYPFESRESGKTMALFVVLPPAPPGIEVPDYVENALNIVIERCWG